MGRLNDALRDYILYETHINNDEATREELLRKYFNLTNGISQFNVQDAEEAYAASQAVDLHDQEIELSRNKLNEVSSIVYEYLNILDNKPIIYTHPIGTVHTKYTFFLNDDGQVEHSPK
jgi:hypothetical protein